MAQYQKSITISGAGYPCMDIIMPDFEDINKQHDLYISRTHKIFAKLLREALESNNNKEATENIRREISKDFMRALEIPREMLELGGTKRGGDKVQLSGEVSKTVTNLAFEADSIYQKYGLSITQVGGTEFNKIYTYKLCNQNADAKLVCAVNPEDKAGSLIIDSMNQSGIQMGNMVVDKNGNLTEVNIKNTRVNMIVNLREDRIALNGEFEKSKDLFTLENLKEQHKDSDIVIVESTKYDELGRIGFKKYIDGLAADGKIISFSMPTKKEGYLNKQGELDKRKIGYLRYASEKAQIVSFNGEEAIMSAQNNLHYNHEIHSKDDREFQQALKLIRDWAKNFDNKVVLVTNGKHGSHCITNKFEVFCESEDVPDKKIVSKIGAGDNFAGAFLCEVTRSGEVDTSAKTLYNAMRLGSKISALCIQQQGAQLDMEVGRKAVEEFEYVNAIPKENIINFVSKEKNKE